ncbi:hypothetical protein DPMN_107511 [Dreissena polymorpha]|uniref:Uncharacterized protein n=1 Tax=Dreissena polymorpha TaxID=45954 RepID=A0A9D4K7A7_DREPO|nr:hypothetical protein DPMN_107511 [Dreissena polymorpha]
MRVPWGVHVNPTGQVLICGWESDTILQVGNERRTKLATLATGERDGIINPASVVFNITTSSIIVGQDGNNNIVVLRVKS